jgi:hypothetical protein
MKSREQEYGRLLLPEFNLGNNRIDVKIHERCKLNCFIPCSMPFALCGILPTNRCHRSVANMFRNTKNCISQGQILISVGNKIRIYFQYRYSR